MEEPTTRRLIMKRVVEKSTGYSVADEGDVRILVRRTDRELQALRRTAGEDEWLTARTWEDRGVFTELPARHQMLGGASRQLIDRRGRL